MDGESIYRYIIRRSEGHPGLPYTFQDRYAGREDVTHILWGEHLPYAAREEWARELVDLILPCLETQAPSAPLCKGLEKHPIYLFLPNLSSRISLYLEEELVNPEQMYGFGIQLATTSENEAQVKLGMIILGQFENDVVARILRTLGLYSSLTLYALEASRNFQHRNRFVFDLARHTVGYGKVVALHILEPVRQEQKEWIFSQGAVNHVAVNLSALMCLEKTDMAEYYYDLVMTDTTFSKLSHILAYTLEHNPVGEDALRVMLVEKYLAAADKYARSFIDLAALITIQGGLKQGIDKMWAGSLRETCRELIHQNRWKKIIAMELGQPGQETSLILQVLKATHTVPRLRELIPLIQRDPFDLDLLRHLLVDNPRAYLNEVYDYLQAVLPEEVRAENPQALPLEKLTPENKPDIWLAYLLRALRQEKRYEEDLLLQSLTCRYPEVRIEAARGLRAGFAGWSELVLPALEHAAALEPVRDITQRFQRLLDRAGGGEKKQQYVCTAAVEQSPGDIVLLNTAVTGALHRDLSVVDGELEPGDTLCLVRERDNSYDESAIMVTTPEGYVLGYVPRSDNPIPAALMDGGERLYAVLRRFKFEESSLSIEIRMCKRETRN